MALKILPSDVANEFCSGGSEFKASAVAAVNHPHIVAGYDAGEDT